MSEAIIDVVRDILVEVKGVDPARVVPEATLTGDLEADSLDAIEIIMALEEHYDKELEDLDAANLITVADIVSLIESVLQSSDR